MTTQDLIKEMVLVERVSQWGPQINGQWYGVNDPLEAKDFTAGQTYEILTKVGKPTPKNPQGKRYVAQIVGDGKSNPLASAGNIAPVSTVAGPKTAVSDEKMTKKDWKAKDDAMRLGGLFHDVAQVVAAVVTVNGLTSEQALVEFEKVLTGIIIIRNKLD